jgi:hypothetical protein
MLTLAIVSFLVVTASTGIGFLAYLYDSRRDRRSLRWRRPPGARRQLRAPEEAQQARRGQTKKGKQGGAREARFIAVSPRDAVPSRLWNSSPPANLCVIVPTHGDFLDKSK